MIPALRAEFNNRYTTRKYETLLALLNQRCGVSIDFRIAETPVFLEAACLKEMAAEG